jgi:hypothetical protein
VLTKADLDDLNKAFLDAKNNNPPTYGEFQRAVESMNRFYKEARNRGIYLGFGLCFVTGCVVALIAKYAR